MKKKDQESKSKVGKSKVSADNWEDAVDWKKELDYYKKKMNDLYDSRKYNDHICPHCGRCPRCGRRYNDWPNPYYPYWKRWEWQPYITYARSSSSDTDSYIGGVDAVI